jgi:hypothetical protein
VQPSGYTYASSASTIYFLLNELVSCLYSRLSFTITSVLVLPLSGELTSKQLFHPGTSGTAQELNWKRAAKTSSSATNAELAALMVDRPVQLTADKGPAQPWMC